MVQVEDDGESHLLLANTFHELEMLEVGTYSASWPTLRALSACQFVSSLEKVLDTLLGRLGFESS